MEVKYTVLRDLVSSYKNEKNKSKKETLFSKILTRLDRLILSKLKIFRDKYPKLRQVEQQDLYNSAIIGLYAGLGIVKEKDTGRQILTKITLSIKDELDRTYKMRQYKEINTRSMESLSESILNGLVEKNKDYNIADVIDLDSVISRMITHKDITQEDCNLLYEHVVNDKTYEELGRGLGITKMAVKYRIDKIKSKIKEKLS